MDFSFYAGKRVLITGHTGFKGVWLCYVLSKLGANVTGYSLKPPTTPSLFEICGIEKHINSVIGDIRDLGLLKKTFEKSQPEIVFHLAAQPIVRTGYRDPVYTYDTNVMGTVNIMECVRLFSCVKSLLNATTDKVYANHKSERGYEESERLDGYDPYSNSKSCSELITNCYKRCFFSKSATAVSTARAGNAVGGGDFAEDRIIPDCVRAIQNNSVVTIRNPYSVRPYQHALDCLYAYMLIAMKQYNDASYCGSYNVAPDEKNCIITSELVNTFFDKCGYDSQPKIQFESKPLYENEILRLDCSAMKTVFGWTPVWDINAALQKTAEWTMAYLNNKNVCAVMDRQIEEYERECLF